jgi:hypothetical protein
MPPRRIFSTFAHAVGLNKRPGASPSAPQQDNSVQFGFDVSAPAPSFAPTDEWDLGDAALFGTKDHEVDRDILSRLAAGVLAGDLGSIANRDILEQILSDGAGCLPGEKNVYYVIDRENEKQSKELLAAKINPTKVPFRTNYWGASSCAAMGGSHPNNWAIVISHVPEDFGPLLYGTDVQYGGSSRMYLSDDALEAFNKGIVGHIIPSASMSNCWPTYYDVLRA